MWDVHVLAIHEHCPSSERVGEEHPRIRQAPGVSVRMLVNIPEQHEEHERRAERNQPECYEIDCRQAARGPAEMSEDHKQEGVVTKTYGARKPARIDRTERRAKNRPVGQAVNRY